MTTSELKARELLAAQLERQNDHRGAAAIRNRYGCSIDADDAVVAIEAALAPPTPEAERVGGLDVSDFPLEGDTADEIIKSAMNEFGPYMRVTPRQRYAQQVLTAVRKNCARLTPSSEASHGGETASGEVVRLREALERIERWEMPSTGKFWENADGSPSDRPMSYSAAYGSNGERDVIRSIARATLTSPVDSVDGQGEGV